VKNDAPLAVKISESVSQIDRAVWEDLFGQVLKGYDFVKTCEETLKSQFKFYYVTILDGHRPLCIAPCFVMDYPLDTTIEGPLKGIALRLRKRLPGLLTPRVVMCGHPTTEGFIGVKDNSYPRLVERLVDGMRSIAKDEDATIIAFKEFTDKDDGFLGPLLNMGFHRVRGYPSVEIDIRFKSFGEYLSTLSRSTRRDLKRKYRAAEGAKIEMEVKNSLGDFLDDAYRLYLDTFERGDAKFEKISKEFFEAISASMPEAARYFIWRLDGKLVAFAQCFVWGDTLIDEYIGIDYNFAYKYHLYFLTFRDTIEWCIKNGIRRYQTGSGNYEPKKRLDFALTINYIYFRHLNPAKNVFYAVLAGLIKPENFDPVLKSAASPGSSCSYLRSRNL
jgi:hypothetical protein